MGNVCCARLLRTFVVHVCCVRCAHPILRTHLSLQTSTTSGKPPVKSVKSHTVTVEMEGVLLLPLGRRRTLVGAPAAAVEAPVPLAVDPALGIDNGPNGVSRSNRGPLFAEGSKGKTPPQSAPQHTQPA